MKNEEATVFGTGSQTKTEKVQENNSKSWKSVTIGGVTGIIMGAAGMYAANAFADEKTVQDTGETTTPGSAHSHTTGDGLHVAEVDQNLSFGEAFAAARNEVGPGGVFHWHGGIYNTYTEVEWNNMSEGERAQFAQQVQPEIQPGEERTGQDAASKPHHPAEPDGNKPEKQEPEKENDDSPKPPTPKPEDDEPEVHFLGVERIENENGQSLNVGHMVIGNQEVALVDVDDNMIFDVAVSDRNDNGHIDNDEVLDISEQQLSVTDFAVASAAQENSAVASAQPEVASQPQQDNIAEDMPDYMNDADVQTI